jgi:hypothetical protein
MAKKWAKKTWDYFPRRVCLRFHVFLTLALVTACGTDSSTSFEQNVWYSESRTSDHIARKREKERASISGKWIQRRVDVSYGKCWNAVRPIACDSLPGTLRGYATFEVGHES